MKGETGLQPVHYKALELVEEGSLTLKDIAKTCNFSKEHFYALYEGDTRKAGPIAALFQSELRKVTQRNEAKIRSLTKDNKKLALIQLNDRLKELQNLKPGPKKTNEVTRIMNTLNKASANIEINSFSVHKSFSDKELIDEFKRLSAIAKQALDGKAVQRSTEGGSGVLLDATPEGDSVQKE